MSSALLNFVSGLVTVPAVPTTLAIDAYCTGTRIARHSGREFGCKLDNAADSVSDVRGADDRQNGVVAVAISPDVKRLAKVAGLRGQALRCGDVEETTEANCRIHGEAAEGRGRRLQPELKNIVGENHWLGEICRKRGNPVTHLLRYVVVVSLGDRIKNGVIEFLVALENGAIELLVRISDRLRLVGFLAATRRDIELAAMTACVLAQADKPTPTKIQPTQLPIARTFTSRTSPVADPHKSAFQIYRRL